MHLTESTLRAWHWHVQGLDGSFKDYSPARILSAAGWARSVGGACVYLTLHSRGGHDRKTVDEAAADRAIYELPSVRGCVYAVAASDATLALAACRPFKDPEIRLARRLGVTKEEQDRLCAAIMEALASGPLDPAALRKTLHTEVRSLGAEGKKKGLSSTLPIALGLLQAKGRVRRIPADGRLDSQRYLYERWEDTPLIESEPGGHSVHTGIARRYFEWAAPATLAEFRWFSGLGARAARAAIAPLGLLPLERGGERLLLRSQQSRLKEFEPAPGPDVQLLSSLDSLFLLRRNLDSLTARDDRQHPLLQRSARGLTDLPHHPIVDGGRLVGLWEYDAAAETIVWAAFGSPTDAMREAVSGTEAFIRRDLGDARAYSLDTPKRRAKRISALSRFAA